jgi:transcriptional regulator with XRE-family HTH domain
VAKDEWYALDPTQLGRLLEHAREQAGWKSPQDAADQMGIHRNTLRRYEAGTREMPLRVFVEAVACYQPPGGFEWFRSAFDAKTWAALMPGPAAGPRRRT